MYANCAGWVGVAPERASRRDRQDQESRPYISAISRLGVAPERAARRDRQDQEAAEGGPRRGRIQGGAGHDLGELLITNDYDLGELLITNAF